MVSTRSEVETRPCALSSVPRKVPESLDLDVGIRYYADNTISEHRSLQQEISCTHFSFTATRIS